jgi:polyisoprenoid-binding protein YceI
MTTAPGETVAFKVNKTSYSLDPSHSLAEFAVKHLGFSTVRGHFNLMDFSVSPPVPRAAAMIVIDENDLLASSVEATIETAMIDTNDGDRDEDLRSANFLDVENFPTMTFKSTKVERTDDENWLVTGDLTLHGVTRSVVLETTFDGRGPGQNGIERVAFSATTSINRRDFGISYNPLTDAGAAIAGEEVRISLELECPKYAKIQQTEEEWAAIEAVKLAEQELEEANVSQDFEVLHRVIAEDLVYYAGTGAAQTKAEFIGSLKTRNSENAIRNSERTKKRADDQGRGTIFLLSGLRVGEEDDKAYEIEYHGDVVLTNKLYGIQDSMPGQPLVPGPERHLRFVRGWKLNGDQWQLFSHRYIHALD